MRAPSGRREARSLPPPGADAARPPRPALNPRIERRGVERIATAREPGPRRTARFLRARLGDVNFRMRDVLRLRGRAFAAAIGFGLQRHVNEFGRRPEGLW